MSVTATCGGCGKTYTVGTNLQGKRVKCKACGTTFRVPEPPPPDEDMYALAEADDDATAVAAAAPSPARPAPPRAAPPPPPSHLTGPGVAAPVVSGAPVAVATPRGYVLSDAARLAIERAQEREREAQLAAAEAANAEPMLSEQAQRWIAIAVLGVPILLALAALAVPGLRGFAMFMLLAVGIGLVVWGYFGVLVVASAEGGYHPILAFVFMPYWLFYVVTRWVQTKAHAARYAGGLLLLLVAVGLTIQGEYRELVAQRAAAAAAVAAQEKALEPPTPPDQFYQAEIAAKDQTIAAALAAPDRREARAWLAAGNPRTAIGTQLDVDQVRTLTEGLYGAGAAEVHVVHLGRREERFDLSPQIVAVLPSDKAARKKVLLWKFQRAYEQGEEGDDKPEFDVGQKYVTFDLDEVFVLEDE